MASPKMYLTLARSFFQRNNPLEVLAMNMIQGFYNLVTLRSRLKLLKYRYMLEMQKLNRIENSLKDFNPYEHGTKMNRTY